MLFRSKAGEFYTPQQISSILSGIVTLDSQDPKTGQRKKLNAVFDFACGSGSLLLNVRHRMTESGGTIGKILGMEKNITTYNLARMNMLLHGVKDTEFEIYHGDTLTNDWDYLRETNPARKPAFDAVVANPPFSTAQQEAEIDLAATQAELVEIEKAIRISTNRHNEFLRELGLFPLPSSDPGSSIE